MTQSVIYEAGYGVSIMIIIGTQGRNGIEKFMFGSVASKVVAGAPCPVITVNPFRLKGNTVH